MVAHPEKITYQAPDGHFSSAQKQWKLIKTLNKQRSQFLTQLESHVYTANPELLQYCKNGVPAWILKLLKGYPTAKKLSRARPNSISKIPYITEEKAKKLINAAKNSIASASDIHTENTITTIVSQILHLTGVINEQNKIFVDNFSTPESELLDGIPSVGIESAIGMMIEIQNIERFSSVKKLAAYFGLHPVFKESGDKGSGYRMSKKGRKEPRRILYMITLNAIQNNPVIMEIYKERTSKGMNNMAAIGLCMHKMLRIMYGMLKNMTEFNAEIDRQNREDNESKQKDLEPKNKTRRYQEYDPKAPTSRRQHKKRKEQIQATSQNHNNND
jgi:hypothetical protein